MQQYDRIAVVSHKTTIRLLLSQLLTGDIQCFRKIPCDNSCVTLIEAEQNSKKGGVPAAGIPLSVLYGWR